MPGGEGADEPLRVVVTGGAGFIGSNFLIHAVNKYPSYKFVNVDKLTYCGNPENLRELEGKPNYSFVEEDICSREAMLDVVEPGSVVVNFAAESHVDKSIQSADPFIQTNIVGTNVLLEVARQKQAGLFVQVSTDEVYGSLGFDAPSSTEADTLKPSSPYSASKAAAEMLCFGAARTFKQKIVVTRSSNNFGPRQYPEKVMPLFITNLLEGKKVPVYGEGKNVRDWLYVQDNCEAIDLVMHEGEPGEVYNIGGGNEVANIELTRSILEGMDAGEESIEFVKDRPGHDLRYSLDCSKIGRLGWTPRYEFGEALRETISWYKDNQGWWKPLKKVD